MSQLDKGGNNKRHIQLMQLMLRDIITSQHDSVLIKLSSQQEQSYLRDIVGSVP